jgi:hypothetical protein
MRREVTMRLGKDSTRRGQLARRWGTMAAVGGLVASVSMLGAAGGAGAAAGKTPAQGKAASAPAAGKSAPRIPFAGIGSKITTVINGPFTAANGVQTRGVATCPGTKQPAGGGALTQSSNLNANINSSFPSASGWIADVNNNSGSDTTFFVYAVCAPHNLHYTVVVNSVTDPAFSQTTGFATCPAHTFVRGGGALSSSGSVLVNINSTLTAGNGWRVDGNNATGSGTTLTVFAVCANKPAGYTVVFGSSVTNAAGTETPATVACPAGSPFQLGGGGVSSSGSTAVNMNSTLPTSSGWEVFENNASGSDTSISAQAICVS